MGGKNFGFPWKILQPANLKGGQKVCKKEGAKKIFNSSNFLQNLISKNPEYSPARQCSFLTPPPPTPPLILFGQLFVRTGIFWRGIGIITLWISTWAKGGVCGPAVYFVLTNGDLRQRE
jgi:hypothetical protein